MWLLWMKKILDVSYVDVCTYRVCVYGGGMEVGTFKSSEIYIYIENDTNRDT